VHPLRGLNPAGAFQAETPLSAREIQDPPPFACLVPVRPRHPHGRAAVGPESCADAVSECRQFGRARIVLKLIGFVKDLTRSGSAGAALDRVERLVDTLAAG
jgi:hypothetical protein